MKLRTNVFVAAAMVTLFAVSAFAQLSQEYKDWATGPAAFLMTDDEKTKWKSVRTDADAKNFVDLFWARRDPTPGTPANEFRDEFNARVEYADRHFAESRKKGSLTELGRTLIILGAPVKVSRSTAAPRSTAMPSTSTEDQNVGRQVWVYEQGKTNLQLGAPTVEVAFIDQYQANQWTPERGGKGGDIGVITRRAVQSYITQPDLTAVPTYSAAAQTGAPMPSQQQLPAPTPAASASAVSDFKTPSLRTAVNDFKTAKNSPLGKNISVTYTELLSPTGDFYVPVQMYIPKSAGLTAESATTFFGLVEDATGNTVAVFEEPAKLSASKGDLYFDRSLSLPPGSYRATLGLAGADGKPVVMQSAPMDLTSLSKDKSGISRLVLANDVHETEDAAMAGSPYAFGRVKIVPKGDRVFTNKDEINYFIEVMNPAMDDATNTPKIQVKLDLVQLGKNGRTISAPISDASPLPLTGQNGPGQYAILAGIPLGQMKNPLPAGDYTLRIKVYDQVKKENWTTEQKLTLVDAGGTTTAATK